MAPLGDHGDVGHDAGVDEDYVKRLNGIETGLTVYILGFLIVFGVTGNVCCLMTMTTRYFRQLRSTPVLCALAVADIGVLCSSAMYNWVTAITDHELDLAEESAASCKVLHFASEFFLLLSAWSLVLVSVERMLAVTKPEKVHVWCSRRRMVAAWFTIFFVLVAWEIYIPIFYNLHPDQHSEKQTSIRRCDFPAGDIDTLKDVLYYTNLVVGAIVPSACIIVNNWVIISKLSKRSRDKTTRVSTEGGSSRKSKSVTAMLVVVSAVFVICTLPLRLVHLMSGDIFAGRRTDPEIDADYRLTMACLYILYFTNNAINFILYVAAGSRFRRAFRELFCRQCCKMPNSAGVDTDTASYKTEMNETEIPAGRQARGGETGTASV